MHLSKRMQSLQPSATLALNQRAASLRRDGVDVIALTAGEPDMPTPAPIIAAMHQAALDGHTRYSDSRGLLELREALVENFSQDGLSVTANQIVITQGAKHALYQIFQALLNPGDEVLVPAPFWVSYPAMIALAGGHTVEVPPQADGSFDPQAVLKAVSPKTKMVILNFPNNPSGETLSDEALSDFLKALPQDVVVVSDEIYRLLHYGDQPPALLATLEGAHDRVVTINGFSKAWSMTGWRVGYMVVPEDVAAKVTALQSQMTSNVCPFIQYGALAALQADPADLESRRQKFLTRRDLVLERLQGLGVNMKSPGGAFYAFPKVSPLLERTGHQDVAAWVEDILVKAHVAMVPGAPFGAPEHCRLSFAVAEDTLHQAFDRIDAFIKS